MEFTPYFIVMILFLDGKVNNFDRIVTVLRLFLQENIYKLCHFKQ